MLFKFPFFPRPLLKLKNYSITSRKAEKMNTVNSDNESNENAAAWRSRAHGSLTETLIQYV